MQKDTGDRIDDFIQAQITEIDLIYEYKKIKLPELSFEDFTLDRRRYFSLDDGTDKWYYLKHILPRLKLLYFDNNSHVSKQYLLWVGGEHEQLVLSGEYERFYSNMHNGTPVVPPVSEVS